MLPAYHRAPLGPPHGIPSRPITVSSLRGHDIVKNHNISTDMTISGRHPSPVWDRVPQRRAVSSLGQRRRTNRAPRISVYDRTLQPQTRSINSALPIHIHTRQAVERLPRRTSSTHSMKTPPSEAIHFDKASKRPSSRVSGRICGACSLDSLFGPKTAANIRRRDLDLYTSGSISVEVFLLEEMKKMQKSTSHLSEIEKIVAEHMVYSDAFEKLIIHDKAYSAVLERIKNSYDMILGLLGAQRRLPVSVVAQTVSKSGDDRSLSIGITPDPHLLDTASQQIMMRASAQNKKKPSSTFDSITPMGLVSTDSATGTEFDDASQKDIDDVSSALFGQSTGPGDSSTEVQAPNTDEDLAKLLFERTSLMRQLKKEKQARMKAEANEERLKGIVRRIVLICDH
ncbi:hypothetical protein ADUPG1_006800 [Aduncisulcus paluster]|uniref:Translin-associated factor X-interacting protein 1 N-terminal domain-containing protein n=1 Tax=Aduncisulcus paluster TaxID=2918883 RepID=A0ABQ5KJM5_9EUKA|nr:hypothetical protein ADUPG1_006800 [Aduncisulcus paluster]